MRTWISRISIAAAGFLTLGTVGTFAADEPYLGLARQLAGNYEGVAGPGNKLLVVVQPARPVLREQRFTVTVEGKYNGDNVRFDGFLSMEPQGKTVRLIWATRRSDCQVDIHPAGDGYEGVTLPGSCQTAFQNPISGKWEFQTEPGSFRLRSLETGETLRFRKVRSPAP